MFVDGWNFYGSLADAKLKPYGWCDFALLAQQQCRQPDAIVTVKYFTAEDKPNPEKIHDRQKTIWWRALRFRNVQIIEGEFRSTIIDADPLIRQDPRKKWREKQTDIALASHMIADASVIKPDKDRPGSFHWTPGYDEAVLLSGDSDFVPAVKTVASAPFSRRVHVLLPPTTSRVQASTQALWRPLSSATVSITQLTKPDLALALLPQFVLGLNGEKAKCHHTWMWREKEIYGRVVDNPKSHPKTPR